MNVPGGQGVANTLRGNDAADELTGNMGGGLLDGGGGADVLRGQGGTDTIEYDADDATADGGPGSDTSRSVRRRSTFRPYRIWPASRDPDDVKSVRESPPRSQIGSRPAGAYLGIVAAIGNSTVYGSDVENATIGRSLGNFGRAD